MMKGRWKKLFALTLLCLLIAVGCAPSATPLPPAAVPTSAPATPIAMPTTVPPTPTSIPATPTATPPPSSPTTKPIIELGPEAPATKISDIVGVWYYRTRSGSGKMLDGALEFTKEGTYRMQYDSGGLMATADEGQVSFEGTQLKFASTQPCMTGASKMVTCIGVYLAFVRKQGDKPLQLRFTIVEDLDRDRSITLLRELFPLVGP